MKHKILLWLAPLSIVCILMVSLLLMSGSDIGDIHNEDGITVAAVGDSITYGSGLERDETYPKVLSEFLGDDYHVENFGVRSHTAMRTGNLPYTSSNEYWESLVFQPDITLIMLGTNDSKNMNWQGPMEFRLQYEALISAYINNNPDTEIYLMTPPKAFNSVERPTQIDNRNVDEIVKVVEDIAADKGYGLIDINALTRDHGEWFVRDQIHPDKNGAYRIAETVYHHMSK